MGDMRGLEQLDKRSMWEELGQWVGVCGSVSSRVCEYSIFVDC